MRSCVRQFIPLNEVRVKTEVHMKTFLLLMACAFNAFAADASLPPSAKDIEGVYKHRFMNGIITPGKAPMEADTPYESEDIVEIVPYDDSHIYVRAELQFYNGHTCSISGLAGREGRGYVFHDPETVAAGEQPCTLTVMPSRDTLTLTDRLGADGASTCRMHCGARGTLSNYTIPMKARRPIRYLDRLKRSNEYQKAIADLKQYEAGRDAR